MSEVCPACVVKEALFSRQLEELRQESEYILRLYNFWAHEGSSNCKFKAEGVEAVMHLIKRLIAERGTEKTEEV